MSLNSGSVIGLRRVLLPSAILSKFEELAEPNTSKNIETCGILSGKFFRNQLQITHLIIPKQSGTSDSCTTNCEEELNKYLEKHDLEYLGTIHTHPSQPAFLSSVDLHTQFSLQMMLPEAISVVVAPKYNNKRFFSLTDHGLDFIANCHEDGFHTHPEDPPLFAELGHVELDHQDNGTIVDLR